MKKLPEAILKAVPDLLTSLNAVPPDGLTEAEKGLLLQLRDVCVNGLNKFTSAEAEDTQLSHLFNSMSGLVTGLASLSAACKRLTADLAATTNSLPEKVAAELQTRLPAAVEAAIAERLKTGDLVEKNNLVSLCSAAETKGIELGKAQARQEYEAAVERAKTLNARKEAVTQNALPVPAEDVLALPEDQFKPALEKAAGRKAALSGYGVTPDNELMARVWASDGEFATVENILKAVPALNRKGAPPINPLAGGSGPNSGKVHLVA